ncbi:MAG TPA: DUF1194 domain-containing protein [Hyphomonadaceae bacterium]|jgi:hypothetical protein|nr:DUF1194 domain-containing protein [Hyphomonadaceae bacterium]
MTLKGHLKGAATLVLAGLLGLATPVAAQDGKAMTRVDLELVLAVDISRSMDEDEHTLQRNGYVDAFRHKEVIDALMSGPEGRIAVTYMEWAGDFDPIVAVPWTIIDSEAAARAFADRLAKEPIYGEERTSISNALITATKLIEGNDIASHRQAIDVSGDGANNAGPQVDTVRDEVVKRGITINGLPIMLEKPKEFYDIDHLDRYYKHCVIGGPAAFIAPVFDLKQLSNTIRKKLVMEIAALEVAPGTAPIQFADAPDAVEPQKAGIVRAQLRLPKDKTDCTIGEQVWGGGGGGRRGGFGGFPPPRRP